MKIRIKVLWLFAIFFALDAVSVPAQVPYNERYKKEVFAQITTETNVVYGNAPALSPPYLNENNTFPQDLLIDIYQPVGDTLAQRPTLVCAHSGAFISGSKDADDMVAFCDSMAHRGYVTASIDYRLGMNFFNTASSIRAVYRGIQDGRAAIRFLKEKANDYGIDTNNIYLLGSSAGSFIGLHNLFMDTEAERPPETYSAPDLGCLDCSGNSYTHSGKANGVMVFWGALYDTGYIVATDTLPLFMAHGMADATVPFGYGSPFGNTYFPATYGSQLVSTQLTTFGHTPETYFVPGVGHEFYGTSNGNWNPVPNAYWDTIFSKTVDFAYSIHSPVAGFYITAIENAVTFTDTSRRGTSYYWDLGDGTYSTEQNPHHTYDVTGDYTVIQFVSNDLTSWDTVSMLVPIVAGLPNNRQVVVTLYPNPAKNYVKVVAHSPVVAVQVTNSAGKPVYSCTVHQKEFIIPLHEWDRGIYFVKLRFAQDETIKKLMVF